MTQPEHCRIFCLCGFYFLVFLRLLAPYGSQDNLREMSVFDQYMIIRQREDLAFAWAHFHTPVLFSKSCLLYSLR